MVQNSARRAEFDLFFIQSVDANDQRDRASPARVSTIGSLLRQRDAIVKIELGQHLSFS